MGEAAVKAVLPDSDSTFLAGRPVGHIERRRVVKDWAERMRMGPDGFLESRTPTEGPAKATSTQVLLASLRVLLRQCTFIPVLL
jgi:hypothetical protein